MRLGATAPVAVTVETAPDGTLSAETPMGQVTLSGVERDGDRIRFTCDAVARTAFVARVGDAVFVQRDGVAQDFVLYRPGRGAAEVPGDAVLAPMPGLVRQLSARGGEAVLKGQVLVVLEAMKMEHSLRAPRDGEVAEVFVAEGEQVAQGALLLRLTEGG